MHTGRVAICAAQIYAFGVFRAFILLRIQNKAAYVLVKD